MLLNFDLTTSIIVRSSVNYPPGRDSLSRQRSARKILKLLLSLLVKGVHSQIAVYVSD